jgi:Na+/proline symporter
VALAALVLVPIGAEADALNGAGRAVAGDRELAYPVVMGALLGPGILGLMVVSLLAAFMSTVDTHINWGASYIVNDVFVRLRPRATDGQQILVGRLSVIAFVMLAVLVSFRMETIEQAWKWMATLGAALGVPTALRWLWWRVTATAELAAIITGLGVAFLLVAFSGYSYEQRLIATSSASVLGMLGGIWIGPGTDRSVVVRFVQKVSPIGFWPGTATPQSAKGLLLDGARWAAVVGGVILMLMSIQQVLLYGRIWIGIVAGVLGISGAYWGCSERSRR